MSDSDSRDDIASLIRHRRLLSWAWGGLVGLGTAGAAITVWLWATAAGSGAHKATTANQIQTLEREARKSSRDRRDLNARVQALERGQGEIRVELKYTNQALDRLMRKLDVEPPARRTE